MICGDDWKTGQRHQGAKPNCRIQAAEHFHAGNPRSIRQLSVHFCHQFVVCLAAGFGAKISGINIREVDFAQAISAFQKIDLPKTKRTAAIEEDFYSRRFRRFYCHASTPKVVSRLLDANRKWNARLTAAGDHAFVLARRFLDRLPNPHRPDREKPPGPSCPEPQWGSSALRSSAARPRKLAGVTRASHRLDRYGVNTGTEINQRRSPFCRAYSRIMSP